MRTAFLSAIGAVTGFAPESRRKYCAGGAVFSARNSNVYTPGSRGSVVNLPLASVIPVNKVFLPCLTFTCTFGATLAAGALEAANKRAAQTV